MFSYTHDPLREPQAGSLEIRVLTLQHGARSDPIHITFATQNIDRNTVSTNPHTASWETLSYTWGTASITHTIYVQSGDSRSGFEVMPNLFAALLHLRLDHEDRELWIDAICIDQRDTDQAQAELAQQIPAMLDIYATSRRTIIWLGEEQDDSTFALQFLQGLGEGFDFDWTTYQMTANKKLQPGVSTFLRTYEQHFYAGNRPYEAVCALLMRDWFGRVWIRQEAFAASKDSIMACGSYTIPLDDFRNSIQILGERGLDVRHANFEATTKRLEIAIAILDKATMSIPGIMDRMRTGNCSLPQDKVYGCLGMISSKINRDFAESIRMNEKNVSLLFQHFFEQYMARYGHLSLLNCAGLCQRSELGGPSWMPDWTAKLTRVDMAAENAVSHGMVAEASFQGGNILRVHGLMAGQITAVDFVRQQGDLGSTHWPAAYAELARLMTDHIDTDCEEHLEAFLRAFYHPLKGLRVPTQDVESRWSDYKTFVEAVWSRQDPLAGLQNPDPNSFAHFQMCLRYHEQNQLPFIFTEDHHIGIGAHTAQLGDRIAAVLGCRNLTILRSAIDEAYTSERYELVGLCSVHGLNNGEALLGPLPLDYVHISRLDPDRGVFQPYYLNTRTAVATFWDPRIDWAQLEVRPDDGPSYKINSPAGEPERHVPTAQWFRRFGLDIVDIDLI